MPHQDEHVVREYIEAIGSGDFDRAVELVTEDVTMHVPGRNPMSGELRGREALMGMFRGLTDRSGGTIVPEVHDLLATDDHVVALLSRTIAGVEARAAVVYHVRDGKITEIWPHEHDQYALDEAITGS